MSKTKQKKPDADFDIYFQGAFPEQLPFRAVADAVSSVQKMIHVDEEDPGLTVHVLDIVRGSAIYRCVASDPNSAITRLQLVGSQLTADSVDDGLARAFPSIHRLSEIAQQTKTTIRIRRLNGNQRQILAVIEPDTYAKLKTAHTVSGPTVLFGELKRVGGVTSPRCTIRAHNQAHAIYCSLDRTQATELAPRLYGQVALEGQATWVRATWDVVEFRVNRIIPYQRLSFAEAKQSLRKAGAARWDRTPIPKDI